MPAELAMPPAVKLKPYVTAQPSRAAQVTEAGVNCMVLCDRFCQPDRDIETLGVVPSMALRTSQELRLPLRWHRGHWQGRLSTCSRRSRQLAIHC